MGVSLVIEDREWLRRKEWVSGMGGESGGAREGGTGEWMARGGMERVGLGRGAK